MIDKISTIKFLIEECYRKFPELADEIPEEEMYRILENNISTIIAGGTAEDFDGEYDTSEKTISLMNMGEGISLEDIKKEQDTVGVLAHEGIHALFRKNDTDTGIDKERKRVNIKGFERFRKARYKSSKSILEHIRDLKKIQDDWSDNKCFGTALNEGITEWIKMQTVSSSSTYDMEVNVVEQIENIIGARKILEIVNIKPEEMYKALNMSENEFRNFCDQMDYLGFLDSLKENFEDNLLELDDGYKKLERFNKEEGKYINDEIRNTMFDIQTKLIIRLIIPYFEENYNKDGTLKKALKCEKLIRDYLECASTDKNIFIEFIGKAEYEKLNSLVSKVIIQYAKQNLPNIDKWEKKKVFDVYYDLIYKFSIIDDSGYRAFIKKLEESIKKIQLEEEKSILEKIAQKINGQKKIDMKLFLQDYRNRYTTVNINKKVSELLLGRRLTLDQYTKLEKELGVYCNCGKVISRKDIRKERDDSGNIEYYVLVNGRKYINPNLKKLKFGKKFLSSRKYEIKVEEKSDISKPTTSHNNIYATNFRRGLIVEYNEAGYFNEESSINKTLGEKEER